MLCLVKRCTGLPEPSLPADTISTENLRNGLYIVYPYHKGLLLKERFCSIHDTGAN